MDIINKMNNSSKLVIGFDAGKPKGDERPCMIVAVQEGDTLHAINQFQDNEAVELYKKLTGKTIPDGSVIITLNKQEAEVLNILLGAEITKLHQNYSNKKPNEMLQTCYKLRNKIVGGKYQCFHCGATSVVWNADFDFSEMGYKGNGVSHICHCDNCGAEIEYKVSTDNSES